MEFTLAVIMRRPVTSSSSLVSGLTLHGWLYFARITWHPPCKYRETKKARERKERNKKNRKSDNNARALG